MNSLAIVNISRFLVLIAFEFLVLRQIYLGPFIGAYFRVFMYPLFLLLLPYRMSAEVTMLIGFGTGLLMDTIYGTFGIHASTCVGLMAARIAILQQLQPKGGYNLNKGLTPDSYGWPWFIRYIGFAYIFFAFWLSILEVFQIWKIGEILLRTLFTLPASLFFIFISVQVLNPRN